MDTIILLRTSFIFYWRLADLNLAFAVPLESGSFVVERSYNGCGVSGLSWVKSSSILHLFLDLYSRKRDTLSIANDLAYSFGWAVNIFFPLSWLLGMYWLKSASSSGSGLRGYSALCATFLSAPLSSCIITTPNKHIAIAHKSSDGPNLKYCISV